jgi:hypothetical protein
MMVSRSYRLNTLQVAVVLDLELGSPTISTHGSQVLELMRKPLSVRHDSDPNFLQLIIVLSTQSVPYRLGYRRHR